MATRKSKKKKVEARLHPEFLHDERKSKRYLKELRRIKKHYGRLTPPIIIEEAQGEDSPLHDYFDWDVVEASNKWWLQQARQLVNHFKIQNSNRIPPVPLFFSAEVMVRGTDDDGNEEERVERVYEELDEILDNKYLAAQVLDDGIRDFRSLLNRYRPWKKKLREMYTAYTEMLQRIKSESKNS